MIIVSLSHQGINYHEINSHEINSCETNSHEINFSQINSFFLYIDAVADAYNKKQSILQCGF